MVSRTSWVLLFAFVACATSARIQQQAARAARRKQQAAGSPSVHASSPEEKGKVVETPPVEKYIQMHESHSLSQESSQKLNATEQKLNATEHSSPATSPSSTHYSWKFSLLQGSSFDKVTSAVLRTKFEWIGMFLGALLLFTLLMCGIYKLMGGVLGDSKPEEASVTTTVPRMGQKRMAQSGSIDSTGTDFTTASTSVGRQQYVHEGKLVYEWGQNHEVAKVYIQTPQGLVADDLEIIISARRLTIGRKGKPYFLNEEIYDTVDVEESAWRLCSNGELQVHMAKETPAEWPCVLLTNAEQQ